MSGASPRRHLRVADDGDALAAQVRAGAQVEVTLTGTVAEAYRLDGVLTLVIQRQDGTRITVVPDRDGRIIPTR